MSARVYSRYSRIRPDGWSFEDSVSMTKQEFKNECDINRIMAKYKVTGVLPEGMGVGRYGDFTGVEDFQHAQEILIQAETQFAALPSDVRDRFDNSPLRLLEFVADRKNLEEAKKLGLLKDEAVAVPPAADKVKVPPGTVVVEDPKKV